MLPKQVSETRLHISAKNVKPFELKADQIQAFDQILPMLGIGLDSVTIEDMMAGLRKVNRLSHLMNGTGMDSVTAPITTPSINTPIQFLQNFLPGLVRIITAARKIDELIGLSTVGNWEDEQIVQGVLENVGSATVYSDLGNVPFASWNLNFATRTIVRFEEGMRVGRLEEARAARVQVNSAEMKREGCALSLDIERNLIGFYGFNSGNNQTYGFLNDPNLPNYVTVATGAAGGTTWASKTYLEIIADILTMVVGIRTQSQDTIDPEKVDITLGLPTDAVDRLATVSQYGNSVRDWLRETYPRIRPVSAPQLNNANGGANVAYMFADSVQDLSTDDGRTFIQVVPAKFQVLGIEQKAKGYEEDYSNATAGVMLKRPYAVYRATGI